jgi:cytochrome c biogenesis protein CcdA/thiol-disulfide isomerase/thioredoxin
VLLFLLAYLGGVLTILSPCILPILPFAFARADQPFRKSGLPLLAGMALTFAAVASVATVGGPWLVRANQYGRFAALGIFLVLGLTLLLPALADRLSRPLVALGNKLTSSAVSGSGSGSSVLLGVATGLLWAPCAGPILGLILTGAAIQGATAHTSVLLLSYAAGAATSLAVALLAGGRVFASMKRFLGAERWIRPAIGVAVLLAVLSVALGWDRGFLTQLSLSSTSGVEQTLLDRLHPKQQARTTTNVTVTANADDADGPSFDDATTWINSPPLQLEQLHGKVVLVDFWTYSCINCLRSIPYARAWYEKYRSSGLVVVGVHTPEFAFEKDLSNVKNAVRDLRIAYPVAVDNEYEIWSSFDNNYWPAHYFIDVNGKIRYKHFGEGDEGQSEQWIQQLLKERAGEKSLPGGTVTVRATGAEAAADGADVRSPETYVGYGRAQHFTSLGGFVHDKNQTYALRSQLALNDWGLAGNWKVENEVAISNSPGARIRFRFHARDLHLVLGDPTGKGLRYRVSIDGAAPSENHGMDTDAQGNGIVRKHRLYQLIRQKNAIQDHVFEIEFLDAGAQAFAFTFG